MGKQPNALSALHPSAAVIPASFPTNLSLLITTALDIPSAVLCRAAFPYLYHASVYPGSAHHAASVPSPVTQRIQPINSSEPNSTIGRQSGSDRNQLFQPEGRDEGACRRGSQLVAVPPASQAISKEDIILLTDDQNGPFGQPTKKNVLGALFWLAKNAQQGEKLVIYYSGHGSVSINKKKAKGKKPSRSSPATADEEMETIYPVDFRSFKEGMIKPSELQEILKPANDKGAKLTIILDAHTGMK